MPLDADQIRVAARGNVHVAPVGTTLPTSPTGALDAAFKELGYITDEGASFTAGQEVEDIPAWQTLHPVKRIVTARSGTVGFELMQWSQDGVALAFGGGVWTEPTAGVHRYDPPADGDALAEYAMVIDAIEGSIHYRWVVKRGNVSDDVETTLVRTAASLLPIQFAALAPDGEDRAWYFLSDDPAHSVTP